MRNATSTNPLPTARRLAVALLVAAAMVPNGAGGQGTAAAWDPFNDACGRLVPVWQPVSDVASCSRPGATADMSASAVNGIMQVTSSAAADWPGPPDDPDYFPPYSYEDAFSGARWADALLFGGPVPARVVFSVALTGSVDLAVDAETFSYALMGVGIGVNAAGDAFWTPAGLQLGVTMDSAERAVSWAGTLVGATDPIPIGGAARFPFEIALDNYAAVSSYADFPFVGRAVSDFPRAGVTGLTFLDAAGNRMTDVPYTFEQGLRFYSPAVTTPEPATWTLLGAGLALLGAARRARRSSSDAAS